MENQDIRWHLRLINYSDALKSITDATLHYDTLNELEKDGLIQRFEFTFELSWKLMQDYLKEIGYTGLRGPRPSITQMASDGLVDPFVWSEMLEARNELSHIYNEEKSRAYIHKIVFDYVPALEEFKIKMLSIK